MHNKDIFYIAGYDPRSYRYYYKTYKENIKKYNKITNENVQISTIYNDKEYNYFLIENTNLKAKYAFLEWQEIIKENWSKSSLQILKDFFYLLFNFILNFKFIRFYKVYKISLIAGFYPPIYIVLFLSMVFFIIYKSFSYFDNIYLFIFFVIILIFFANKLFLYFGKKFAAFWLLNICVFSSKLAKNKIKDIDNIVNKFANEIINTLKNNQESLNYELILISHSVGTIINILVLNEVIKQCVEQNISYDNLKILTLGECILLCSLVDKKSDFIKKLDFLSDKKIFWVDFTSKIDGACFYLVDFFEKSGVKSNPNVLYLSSAFYKLYDKLYYKKIMRKWYTVHFMYLFATDFIGRYNFFAFSAKEDFLENKLKEL
ncbi:DUF829 domain-containing protein [Campylobacter sp. Cr9]|uniref:DUF829 domain-containing protein n=1 Tax=Campylobacter sp. Cr9 TaxID=2735728 RepID=UPI003014BFBF|nr:DUF829 domain-containing protein [Campylobacter sp. Cr9]